MKTILLVFTLFICTNTVIGQREEVSITNVQAQYKSLGEVKAILVNSGKQPIYLLPEECGEALVSFMSEEHWWPSDEKPCPRIVESIEIKPGGKYEIPRLVIRLEQSEEGKYVEDLKGMPGKFKIEISYSFKRVRRNGVPQLKEKVEKEFEIVE